MKYIQIQTSVFSKEQALEIAEKLVREKLAGCVQVLGPMASFYKWKGKMIRDEEYLLMIKTKESLYKQVEEQIKKMHPYEIPEILALAIIKGNKNYLEWIDKVTK